MNTLNKTMIVGAIGAIALFVSACTPSVTVEAPPAATADDPSGISVSGTGKVTGTPDTLTMSFGVSVRRDTVSEAVAVAAAKAQAIIDALESNGVAEEDIQTANYSIYPQYDWDGEKQQLLGYQVNNSVIAKIRDIDNAGEVIDAVTAAGGNEVTVSGVTFSIEDNDALIEAAREAAWNDAKAKAEQLAALSGVTLGNPAVISETFSPSPQPFAYATSEFAGEDAAFSTPINPGEQQVAVSLNVRFSISN
jgi:uncharacterized protein YggE